MGKAPFSISDAGAFSFPLSILHKPILKQQTLLKMCSERISRLGGISERTIIGNDSLHWKLLAALLRGASVTPNEEGIA